MHQSQENGEISEDSRKREAVSLAVSIVLYQPCQSALDRTIDSLGLALDRARATGLRRVEVILIDHSPQPRGDIVTAIGWSQAEDDIRLHYEHVGANPGFGAGHNRAFDVCRSWADIFLVANPDLEFAPDSLAEGLAFLVKQPGVGLVAPALIGQGETIRPSCFRYPDIVTLLARFLGGPWATSRSWRYECRDWDAGQMAFNPPLISGCCMLFRAATFARLGGFDSRYFLYFEDFDLSLRAGRQGLSAYLPTMRIRHAGGNAVRKGIRHHWYFVQSAWRFFRSHGFAWK